MAQVEAHVARITVEGRRAYPYRWSRLLTVRFSRTGGTCYLPDGTVLEKVKGGWLGGNYAGVEDGDIYRVSPNRS